VVVVVVMISQKLTLQGLRIIQAPCADHLPSLAKSQRRERERERERERALDILKPGPMHEKRIFLKENTHDSGR
jgi:hypothetical protein